MHTDRKIGFALGILLVGIVAALFFRNEPLLPTDMPTVRRESELNDRLRERDIAVYLDDDSAESEPTDSEQPWTLSDVLSNMGRRNKGQPSAIASSQDQSRPLDGRPPESLDGFRSPRSTIARSRPDDVPLEPPLDRPESLAALFDLTPKLNETSDDTTSGPGTVKPLVADEQPAAPEFQVPEHFEEYVVKYGDTLSGIAQKLLGSQSRYQEIYDANRDRMTSPDQLQIGKPLRIPRLAASGEGTSL